MDFGSDFTTANVTLDSMPYSGSWMVVDDGMTGSDSRFFSAQDVNIQATMEPLSDLTAQTLADITNLHFEWAHPLFNDVAPVSFLTLSGEPVIVPEMTALGLLLLGMACLAVRR